MLGPATPFPHPGPAHGGGRPDAAARADRRALSGPGRDRGHGGTPSRDQAPSPAAAPGGSRVRGPRGGVPRIEALPKAEQEARLERLFRRAVERALADGRVGAIAAAMRLLGLAPRGGGRGPRADGSEDEGLTEEEEREAGKPWGLVPDGEGGWLTPDGREAIQGGSWRSCWARTGPSAACIGRHGNLVRRRHEELTRSLSGVAGEPNGPAESAAGGWPAERGCAHARRSRGHAPAARAGLGDEADRGRVRLQPEHGEALCGAWRLGAPGRGQPATRPRRVGETGSPSASGAIGATPTWCGRSSWPSTASASASAPSSGRSRISGVSWPPRPARRCGSRRRPAGRCRSTSAG